MPIRFVNAPDLREPAGYSHAAIAEGTKLVFLAGQVARDQDGELVGEGDLSAQTAQALRNVERALHAAGATLQDVAKLTIYVVDWRPEKMEQIMAGVMAAADGIGPPQPVPATLVGVQALAEDDLLVEVDATAVLA